MSIKKMMKYRDVWMGIAMLWIMLYHSGIVFNLKVPDYIKLIGYGGVDIFLFASGMGNYFSYLKDESPLDFLKRRISKLAPVYLPFIIVWCAYELFTGYLKPIYIIGNLFGIQDFSSSGYSFCWYLTALIICYLLTPYFASFIKKHDLVKDLLLVGILTIMTTAFWGDRDMIISVTRVPIYVTGMIFSKYSDKAMTKKTVIITALLCCFGLASLYLSYRYSERYLWTYGLHWYPFLFITPFLCYAVSWLSMKIEKFRAADILLNLIRKAGIYSFELFLVHIMLFSIVKAVINKFSLGHTNLVWLAAFAAAIAGAFVLNKVGGLSKKLFVKQANNQ